MFRNDSAPFNRPVTLSETAANFSEIEIFFRTNDGHYSSCKVQSPNGKIVDLSVNVYSPGSGAGYIKAKAVLISGTTIDTANVNGYMTGEAGVGNSYSTQRAGDFIGITGVVGYR